ncbi:3'-5' exonuclease [Alteromonas sediminis]|uniref:3'-5' exonuclease n=1 Tax=Alteromonas sediminis TaxID=2259342 RepID=A0A3N5YLM0_9ALTE|nr:exonuclease domain-containing protein [Alteromonas sediminis]RPJ66091.1 3'-5' exonuclease [Alteromonas sediminis]
MGLISRLKQCFGQQSLPAKWANLPIRDIPLLALDLELTSLDTTSAKITSIGWLCGKHLHCYLHSARHHVVRASGSLQQSPVIHGITQEKLWQGEKLADVIETLVPLLPDHILVLHHAHLDMAVIKRLATKLELNVDEVWVIDTLILCKYLLSKTSLVIKPDSLTLTNCRARYALPAINAHNALDDAMATLELWFACQSAMNIKPSDTLRSLMHTGALKPYRLIHPN